MRGLLTDITGVRYGRLIPQWPVGRRHTGRALQRKHTIRTYWLCLCDCGKTMISHLGLLRKGNTQSCGCLRREITARTNHIHKLKYPDHAAYRLWLRTKCRCLAVGIKFEITPEDIIIPETCPLLGIILRVGKGTICDSSPTLDRIRPNMGYIKGNVQVISARANRAKSNLTLDELSLIVNNWREYLRLTL